MADLKKGYFFKKVCLFKVKHDEFFSNAFEFPKDTLLAPGRYS